jgi:hypothetical protein
MHEKSMRACFVTPLQSIIFRVIFTTYYFTEEHHSSHDGQFKIPKALRGQTKR